MRLTKGAMRMQLNEKNILLKYIEEKSYLILEEDENVKLTLTDDGTADIEGFFMKIINLLLSEPFILRLISDKSSVQIVEEVAEKYIERLNIEINNILLLDDYKKFAKNN